MSYLQGLECAVEAILEHKERVLSHAPNLFGSALASDVYIAAASADKVEVLKWFMRGGAPFCNAFRGIAASKQPGDLLEMQQSTELINAAGRAALSKVRATVMYDAKSSCKLLCLSLHTIKTVTTIALEQDHVLQFRPWQLADFPNAALLAWQRLLILMEVADEAQQLPNMHNTTVCSLYKEAKTGTVADADLILPCRASLLVGNRRHVSPVKWHGWVWEQSGTIKFFEVLPDEANPMQAVSGQAIVAYSVSIVDQELDP